MILEKLIKMLVVVLNNLGVMLNEKGEVRIMDKEEYYKRIEKINNRFKTDRVSADEEYQLVCQRNYLSTKYIEHLEQRCQEQKEVIDKVIEYLEEPNRDSFDYSKAKLLDILKEVSE